MSNAQRILVIGGAGYIGSHCLRRLQNAGKTPVVLDSEVYGHRAAVPAEIPYYKGDLGDTALLKSIFEKEKIDTVMHFAAFTYVGESVADPVKYYINNLAKPILLVKTMLECGVMRFVLSSTCATYGVPQKMPMDESLPQDPINPYGRTKFDLEKMLSACAKAKGLSYATLRYFNAAGAMPDGSIGEDHDPETHLIPLAIAAACKRRGALKIFGTDYPTADGTCLRDYIHVCDLSDAHILALGKLDGAGAELAYNLGTGTPNSVREVIASVERITGLKVPVEECGRRAGDPPALYADASKARRELGWEPHFKTIDSIVETAWAWHRTHPKGFAS